ncbi:minor tail protein [Streptomyces phage phiScoe56]|nr:minor tail protein [Streptomyces phage phiScoe56]
MAQTSYPFDAQTVNETQYSQFFRELQDSGVVGDPASTALKVTSAGTNMTLSVAIGQAVVRGHFYNNDSVASVTIAAADTSARTDLVVLRLDPAANSIVLTVLKGAAGGSASPTQDTTNIYDLPLASVAVGASVTSISAASVTDLRRWAGNRIRTWTTATRPGASGSTAVRQGQLGYNTTTSSWEFWNGTAWSNLVQSVDWSSLSNKPGTFPPSAHTHLWADITDKPTTFAPATHAHGWTEITGKPTTFAPSTHSHDWNSITSKPSTFAPASHSHNYLDASDTIAWANGSKKPAANAASGAGPWYAVWVEGDGTFARNTSSIRFKENVRDHPIDPAKVLALRPVMYDRKLEEGKTSRRTDEFGLIAEEVNEQIPEIINILDGEVDGLRYDLLPVAMLSVLQDQQARIEKLEKLVAELSK